MKSIRLSAGFTMIEMLIALLVLSIGLLGIAALQVRGQQYNHAAYIRTQGTALAYEIMDRMRANIVCADEVLRPLGGSNVPSHAVTAGCATPPNGPLGYGANGGSGADCIVNACTPAQLRDFDLRQWQTNVQAFLPNGTGTVAWVNPPVAPSTVPAYEITISWRDRDDGQIYNQNWTFRP